MRIHLALAFLVAVSGCSHKRYKVPSGSMYPAFGYGDMVTSDTSVKVPARGDVFVFKYPEHPDQEFVKRVVGLPGDRIDVAGRTLTINGRALPTCVVGTHSYTDPDQAGSHTGDLVLEADGASARLLFFDMTGTDGSWTVKPGEYFVMGDNRNNSHDSRMWFGGVGGGVPANMLLGKAAIPKLALPKGASGLEPALAKCKKDLGVP